MVYISIIISIIFLDQLTKKIIENRVSQHEDIEVIKGRFYITNLRNKGAAYGLLSKNPKLLMVFTFSAIIYIISEFIKLLKSPKDVLGKVATAFLLGGAIGNLIDRINKKYVTDFLYIKHKNAPVFNFADIFVLFGTILLIVNYFIKEFKK